jgi:hypothetical protein
MGLFSKGPPTFSDAVSKNRFIEEWVGGILEEAGCRADHPQASEMADTAADGIVRSSLRSVGEAYKDYQVVAYLEELDVTRLSWRVDEMYKTTIEMATAGRPGPVLRERIGAFDKKVNEVFQEIRPNYVAYARTNYK